MVVVGGPRLETTQGPGHRHVGRGRGGGKTTRDRRAHGGGGGELARDRRRRAGRVVEGGGGDGRPLRSERATQSRASRAQARGARGRDVRGEGASRVDARCAVSGTGEGRRFGGEVGHLHRGADDSGRREGRGERRRRDLVHRGLGVVEEEGVPGGVLVGGTEGVTGSRGVRGEGVAGDGLDRDDGSEARAPRGTVERDVRDGDRHLVESRAAHAVAHVVTALEVEPDVVAREGRRATHRGHRGRRARGARDVVDVERAAAVLSHHDGGIGEEVTTGRGDRRVGRGRHFRRRSGVVHLVEVRSGPAVDVVVLVVEADAVQAGAGGGVDLGESVSGRVEGVEVPTVRFVERGRAGERTTGRPHEGGHGTPGRRAPLGRGEGEVIELGGRQPRHVGRDVDRGRRRRR